MMKIYDNYLNESRSQRRPTKVRLRKTECEYRWTYVVGAVQLCDIPAAGLVVELVNILGHQVANRAINQTNQFLGINVSAFLQFFLKVFGYYSG